MLGILGLLVGVVIPATARFLTRGRTEAIGAERRTIEAAVSAYYLDPSNQQQWPTKDGTAGDFGTTTTAINITLLRTRNYLRDIPSTASTVNDSEAEGHLTWYVQEDGKVAYIEGVTGPTATPTVTPTGTPTPTATATATSTPTPTSTPAGQTIAQPDPSITGGQFTSIVLDSAQKPVISYRRPTLGIVHCGNVACTSGNTVSSFESGNVTGTSIVLDSSGNPMVAYVHSSAELRILDCDDPNCTGGGDTIQSMASADHTGTGDFPSLVLDSPSGFPVIAFRRTPGDLWVLHCNDVACVGSDESLVNVTSGGRSPSLRLDGLGKPVISHITANLGTLRLTHCSDADCSASTTNSPHSQSSVSYTSLRLDASGNPVIAYITSSGLKLMHCNDADCSGNNESVVTIDSDAQNMGVSMVLNSSGNPVIAYVDDLNPIMIAVCGDANCSSGNVLASPDPGSGAEWPSITLNSSGHPVVSYYDRNEPTLNLLRCTEADC